MLRQVYWQYRDGAEVDEAAVQEVSHCFDYLRQAVSCYGDTTLEMPLLKADDGSVTTATYGGPRLCRDFDAIYSFTEAHATGT